MEAADRHRVGLGEDAPQSGRRAARTRAIALAWALGLAAATVVEAAAPPGSWWNAAYRYRQKVTLTAGATAVPTQYSMSVVLNHAALVAATQSLASGNDVRVLYWNGTGWVELDRLLDDQSAWNNAATRIWFRTQAAIAASAANDDYYLYYGNAGAGAPPANWANVFLFHDDFNDGVFDTARWSCLDPLNLSAPPACTEAGGTLSLQSDSAIFATAANAFGTNTRWEGSVRLAGNFAPAGRDYNYFGASETSSYSSGDWFTFWTDDANHRWENANNTVTDNGIFANASPTSYHLYTVDREALTGVRHFRDGAQVGLGTLSIPDANLRVLIWNDSGQANGTVVDWLRVRRYVTPEPTPALSPQEGESLCAGGNAIWWNTDWGRRRKITFNNSAQTENLDDFPVLIRLDSSRVDYARTQNSGQDVRFVDQDQTTVLAHEIELWNEAGSSFVWVRVPRINGASASDFIWIYYDNPVAADGQTVAGVWDPGFTMVQHLQETAGAHVDSATADGAANNSVAVNVATQGSAAGRIDGADQLNGTAGQRVEVGDHPNLDMTAGDSFTIEAWVQTTATGWRIVVSKEDAVRQVQLWLDDTGALSRASLWLIGGANVDVRGTSNVRDGSFHYLVGRWNEATSTAEIFVDGVSQGSVTNAGLGDLSTATNLFIGMEGDGVPTDGEFNGILDEVRISKVSRSNDWIRAQHLSMTDAFASFGPELGSCNLRSIGTRPDYGTVQAEGAGTRVSATQGSRIVTGTGGTTWVGANRGRGDRININGANYVVFAVNSDTQLQLTSAYRGPTLANLSYSIHRQFTGLTAWEDCIDGPAGVACPFFPVASNDFVVDNRAEVGVAYKDSFFNFTSMLAIDGSSTDPAHNITLTADGVNRHNGYSNAGVVFDGMSNGNELRVQDANVTIEWIEFGRFRGVDKRGAITIPDSTPLPTNILLQNLLVHTFYDATVGVGVAGIRLSGNPPGGKSVTVRNTMVWDGDQRGIEGDEALDVVTIENCSIDNIREASSAYGIYTNDSVVIVRNTIVTRSGTTDFRSAGVGFFSAASTNNISSDTSVPPASGIPSTPAANLFVNPGTDLHLRVGGNVAVDSGLSLATSFSNDIDGQRRPAGLGWDRGADERDATTAVTLQSFSALALDSAVELSWRTASELDNLGFHLYRALSETGPWTRITTSLIPGLGSSPSGAFYSRLDTGLTNGVRYFYRLEDVDTRSLATFHGPVSAVPQSGASSSSSEGTDEGGAATLPACRFGPSGPSRGRGPRAASPVTGPLPCVATYGDPAAVSLRVLSRSATSAVVELVTGGFHAVHDEAGRVRVSIPGFEDPQDAHAAALPFKRAVLDAEVGRKVRIASVRPLELERHAGLVPDAVGYRELDVRFDGTVRPGRRRAELRESGVRALARLAETAFQGEQKRVVLELFPLRFDARGLVLAKRLVVRVLFTGREAGERGERTRGRRPPRMEQPASGETLAYLHTKQPGLHAVAFETLFPGSRRALSLDALRLERQGGAVAFHVAPSSRGFGPGSVLYFYADRRAGSTAYDAELTYALVQASGGLRMSEADAAPAGAVLPASLGWLDQETNRFYQPGLLEAADLWQWEALVGGPAGTKLKGFVLEGVDSSSSEPGRLTVWLQGGSDAEGVEDHHVRVHVGPPGSAVVVGEARFDGKRPHRLEASVPAGLLREGANELRLENVGDTGVYSLVFLDRFRVEYRQAGALRAGVFEGVWSREGTAEIAGVTGAVAALDVTDGTRPVWLAGFEAGLGTVRLGAQAGRRYLLASSAGLLFPRVTTPLASSLKNTTNQADYLLIAPQAFLQAAEPLVARRESQGLRTKLASLEEITSVFGGGEASGEAIRNFLTFAYHSWQRPSPRYVLLLGDGSSDPRNFTGTAAPAPLPALFLKSSYLWTAADPALAAVNGEDLLPDLAIGRLPARTLEEAQGLVSKLLAWEDSGQGLGGRAVLVADNPDEAGDFEWNVDDVRASYLAGRETTTLRLRELGAATRPAILDAFNAGASLVSYVGHGGAAVWASENVWNSWDAASLQAQSQQPLMLTLNCLNGYFVAPAFDSLSEAYLKAEGRGTIAAFSPSGLSLDAPAHQLHRALMAELTSGAHQRLGDAVLAAQGAYARTGQMPELLSIYHLLGDPAMAIR